MQLKDIFELIKGWDQESQVTVLGFFSGHTSNSYYGQAGRPNTWIIKNFEFLRANKELEIDSSLVNYDYKMGKVVTELLIRSQNYSSAKVIEFIKDNHFENIVLYDLKDIPNAYYKNKLKDYFYLSFRDCLESNMFDCENIDFQNKIKVNFKYATTGNDKKGFSNGLFAIANYFYERRDTLDKSFVIEIIENYLLRGKYIKANLDRTLEMSNFIEKETSTGNDTIEGFCIVKKINRVKIAKTWEIDVKNVGYEISYLLKFLKTKLYTQDQYLAIDVHDKSADNNMLISYERKTKEIEIATEMIDYFIEHKIDSQKYQELWDKIEFKHTVSEKLPLKNTTENKYKI